MFEQFFIVKCDVQIFYFYYFMHIFLIIPWKIFCVMNDNVINSIVTVNTFVVSRFICSVESIFPIDCDGRHKTSPATTTFQHNPNAVSMELTINGRQFSISIFIILFILFTRYIFAMKLFLESDVINPF